MRKDWAIVMNVQNTSQFDTIKELEQIERILKHGFNIGEVTTEVEGDCND